MALMRECVGRWETMLEECLKFDQWGQVVEAQDMYRKWLENVAEALREGKSGLAPDQLRQVRCLQATLRARLSNIRYHSQGGLSTSAPSGPGPGITYQMISQIRERFREHFLECVPWPIPIDAHTIEGDGPADEEEEGDAFHDNRGTLLAPPRNRGLFLKITIESIGLKDATTYLEPFITVSVRSGPSESGRLEKEQDTPQPKGRPEGMRIPFGGTPVFIQTPIENLVRQRANIFFEFKHWKPKKSKVSVRCWSMLGWDELEEEKKLEGTKELEIYAKPADFSARTFHKHSVKPLFLTITCTILENHS
eukprot:Hpha_TRINITY_DN16858_c3_g5::TRINITY_DN16858_c3_g5_i1::g.148441::m.148441